MRRWRLASLAAVGARRSRHALARKHPSPLQRSACGCGCPPLTSASPRAAAQPVSGAGSALAKARPCVVSGCPPTVGAASLRAAGAAIVCKLPATRASRARRPRRVEPPRDHLYSTSRSATLFSPADDGSRTSTLGSEALQRASKREREQSSLIAACRETPYLIQRAEPSSLDPNRRFYHPHIARRALGGPYQRWCSRSKLAVPAARPHGWVRPTTAWRCPGTCWGAGCTGRGLTHPCGRAQ